MQVRIEKLVYGGAGLARTDEGIVFVDRVLPGERVEVEVVQRRKDFSHGRAVEVLEPSEDRRTPVCPNFEAVGCCDWAHIRHPQQVRLKEDILRESLSRLGGLNWPSPIETIASPEEGYRMRAAFHVTDNRPGFIRTGTHAVVPIVRCHALAPALNAFLEQATAALSERKYQGVGSIRAVTGPTTESVAAVFLRGREKVRWTRDSLVIEVQGIGYRLRPMGFFQSNRYLLDPLVVRVLELTAGAETVLDLYCGDGFFSLPLARRARQVVGVERRSTVHARRNAHENQIGNVRFVQSSAWAYLMKTSLRPDTVVLDPPRTGAGRNLVQKVAQLEARRIVYVSCNPTTLAADGRVLVKQGYRLTRLGLIDQFPNTHHIESLALFEP